MATTKTTRRTTPGHPTAAELHLCVERILPSEVRLAAAHAAIKANAANDPLEVLARRKLPGVSLSPRKMALVTGKLWKAKTKLRVRFLDGTAIQRRKTQQIADMWSALANISFAWTNDPNAEIRVSFNADPGSWSAIGTDCLQTDYFRPNEPTMNFGWLRDDTDDVEWGRVVLHEFGHSLGCIHEHSNPRGGITWDEAAVFAAFRGPPNNWSDDDIRTNVLEKYSIDQLKATTFDPLSIMLYAFPGSLILSPKSLHNSGTAENTKLSAGDKRFIARVYPRS